MGILYECVSHGDDHTQKGMRQRFGSSTRNDDGMPGNDVEDFGVNGDIVSRKREGERDA